MRRCIAEQLRRVERNLQFSTTSFLKMEAVCSVETSEAVYPTTQLHSPKEDCTAVKDAKTREFDGVHKILRKQIFAALPMGKIDPDITGSYRGKFGSLLEYLLGTGHNTALSQTKCTVFFLSFLLCNLLTYLLHGAESFLRS